MPPIQVVKDVSLLMVDPAMPSDPAVRTVVDDVFAKLRYSLTAAAAEQLPTAPRQLDGVFREFLATRMRCMRQAGAAALRVRGD
jgi:hypothetical protein